MDLKRHLEVINMKPKRIDLNKHSPCEGVFKVGDLWVIVTIDNGQWHISVSCITRLPKYHEMKTVRYACAPDEIYMAEIFPPKKEFVNLHKFTRHLWQINQDNFL